MSLVRAIVFLMLRYVITKLIQGEQSLLGGRPIARILSSTSSDELI